MADGPERRDPITARHPYRALVLDFAGVLTSPLGGSVRAWCRAQGLPEGAWRQALVEHPEGRALYLDLEAGRIGQREWNAGTAALLGVDPEDLMGRAHAAVRLAPAVAATARAARAAGYTVAMLSNSYGLEGDPYDPYTALGVWELLDLAVVSGREGLAKPDPALYRLLLDRLGLPAAACLFVDDQAANLPPAEALGMATLLADPDDRTTAARLTALLGLPPRP
ncbi:HAD-IA family hydrolase [Kitasatospora sp. NPDC096147]|uniref:HAD-IA family hydrolase n=1 Tax=Kitasatospora sp. NPDC096147 TaxID=3364093 RepID=UPI0037FC089A